MKKYIFLALLTMGVSSCQLVDVLDQKPEFEADLDGAITTPAAVELALNGIYYSLPGNGFNVIFPTVSGSFKAGTMWRQEIVSAGNAVYYSERMLPTLSFSDATEWDADYAVIKNANFLETACNRMSDGEFSGNRRAEVLGEIAYLRALAYFNVLVRYCEFWDMNSEYGVVMRNEAPSVSNALKARSSVADSYQYILDQLEIAIEKAPDWKKLSQASKEAAKALKARVLLYAGKYTEAVAAVNDAIDTNAPLPEANYGDVFDKFSTTKEILFARVFDQKDATNTSTRQQCYGNSPTKKQGYWGPTNEYVELVGDDPRLMPADVMEKLLRLADEGATIVFLEQYPEDVPGLNDLGQRRAEFNKALAQIKEREGKGHVLFGTDYARTLAATATVPEEMKTAFGLSSIRRSHSEGYHYFISALKTEDTESWIPLAVQARSAMLYNPMNGTSGKARLRQNNGRTEVFLQLASGESIILKTFTDHDVAVPEYGYWTSMPQDEAAKILPGACSFAGKWGFSFVEAMPVVSNVPDSVSLGSWTEIAAEGVKNTMEIGRAHV